MIPYMNIMATIHIVPVMSNIPEALDRPNIYHGRLLPPRKYESRFLLARFEIQNPRITVSTRYPKIMKISMADSLILAKIRC